MAKGLVSESEIRELVKQSIRETGEAHIELILRGAGCDRFETLKKLVKEIIDEHFPEEKLQIVQDQDQELQKQTYGDIALMIPGPSVSEEFPSRIEV